jgi:hypothetical protein
VLETAANNERLEAHRYPEILSPAQWATAFEASLRRVHHAYRINDGSRGRAVECLREDETGLFLSQNCVKIHDRYEHCFALLFTRAKLTGALDSPFVLGSRFDHNATILHAYNRDYRARMKWKVAPREWHSKYWPTLRDARERVETTGKTAEYILRPLYLDRLSRGTESVAALFQDAAVLLKEWGISQEILRQPVAEGPFVRAFAQEFRLHASPIDWNDGLVAYFNALRIADANGFPAARLLKHSGDAFNTKCEDIALGSSRFLAIPKDLRSAAIVAAYVEDFLTVESELPMMVSRIENVKTGNSRDIDGPAQPQQPWWRFW